MWGDITQDDGSVNPLCCGQLKKRVRTVPLKLPESTLKPQEGKMFPVLG